MAKLGINTGFIPNDGTGDTLLGGAVKINSNFSEIYSAIGDGTNLYVGTAGTVVSLNSNGNVGVGSTIPTSKVDVSGDVKVSGATTSNSFGINGTQVISSARQLQNIASLDATTKSTIEAAIESAPNNFSDLKVAGVSTFTNGPVLVGSAVTIRTDGINVTGVITATTFSGNATSATTATTATNAQGLTGTPNINVGVITATLLYGDGYNLTNLQASDAFDAGMFSM